MKASPPTVSARALFRRRAALVMQLLFGACVLVGSQGPWWDVFLKAQPLYHHAGYDSSRTPPMLPVAAVAAVAGVVVLFFASYDLASGADLQAPILGASIAALVCAGVLIHGVKFEPDTLRAVLDEVDRAGLPPGAEIAPVDSGARSRISVRDFTLEPCWGLALVVAAAPLMVVVSLYLTFVAERAPEST